VRRVADDPHLALIVRAKRALTRREASELQCQAEAIIVSGARCEDRLFRETSLFLHRQVAQLPEAQRRRLAESELVIPELDGAKILVVDDDVRNIFAMTSALERHRAEVIYAENGREGLELLQRSADVDAVLMDIMMPERDGYKVMRQIRADHRFAHLPLIAVTAKAMIADRDKCIEAGASDYVSKPVDMDQLLSLLRFRLTR
jgi:CheY-like chemotaxis protein